MINVAVIGVGTMGQNHARVYSERKDVKLVAVCDRDKDKAEIISNNHETKCYINHLDLIERENLHAVSIAVPTKFHRELALDFINSGIHVLVEKPLAFSSKEAQEVINKAREKNIVLLVGHVERYNPAVQKIKSLIDRGDFGRILSLVIKRVGLYPPKVSDVNVVTDLAVHDLDILTYLTGKLPQYVIARGASALASHKEDHAEIFLDYGKFGCFIQVNWVTPIKIRTLSLTGSKKYAEVNYITQKIELYKNEYKVKKLQGYEDFVVEYGDPQKTELVLKSKEPLKNEIDNFVKSVKGLEKPLVTGEDGLRAIRLSELINESIKKRVMIKV